MPSRALAEPISSTTIWARIEAAVDRSVAALNGHPVLVLCGVSLLYFPVTLMIAAWRPFWYDELFTFYIARLPSVSDIQTVLATTLDQQPLPYYLVTRWSEYLAGFGELGARLPSVIAFWLGCVSIYEIVRRRTSAAFALLSVILPIASSFVYRYAFEARPYALVFGFTSVALLCWLTAAHGVRRRVSVAGLALSLLAATSSHYYAVLALCAIAIGESVRTVQHRKIDALMWLALVPALTPLLFAHIARNVTTYVNYWSAPRLSFFLTFHERMFGPLLVPGAFLLFLLALWLVTSDVRHSPAASDGVRPPAYEVAAVCGYILIPVFGYIVAVLVTNALVPRYVLPAITGFSILYGWLAFYGSRRSSMVALLGIIVMGGGAFLNLLLMVRTEYKSREARVSMRLPEPALAGNEPVVVENPLLFFETVHRSPNAGRLWYLVDPPTAARYPNTYLDPGLPLLRQVAPVQVENFDSFVRRNRRFRVYGRTDGSYSGGWITMRLIDAGADLRLIHTSGTDHVYAVSFPAANGIQEKK